MKSSIKNKLTDVEYNDLIEDILSNEDVKKLDNFTHHYKTTRLRHSMSVSYNSYVICKFLKLDYRAAARAGLLHDLFLYDWRATKFDEGHASKHPKVALENSKKHFELTEMEEDIIVKHMWPATLKLPKYKESFVVTFVDKLCASYEIGSHVYAFNFIKIKLLVDLIARLNIRL